ncbi:hypothetical protein CMV37_24435 [Bacillus cereus]|nr:hypothetical protein CMV37_24435 [Bacillus cereus]
MRVMSLIRIWFALMVCIILCVGFFFNSKNIPLYQKQREKTAPYKTSIYETKQHPLFQCHKE